MIPGELIYVFQNGLFQQLQVEMIFLNRGLFVMTGSGYHQ